MSHRLEGVKVVFGLYNRGDVEVEAFQTNFGFTVFMDFGAVLGQNSGVFAVLSNMVGKYASGEGMMATMRCRGYYCEHTQNKIHDVIQTVIPTLCQNRSCNL